MKKTLATVVSGAVLLSGAMVTIVSALDGGVEADLRGSGSSDSREQSEDRRIEKPEPTLYGMEVKASSTARIEDSRDDGKDEDSMRGNSTSSAARERHDDDNDSSGDDGRAASSTDDEDGDDELTPGEHRSTVAKFVKHLLEIADNDRDGLGEEVRVVARAQNDSASTTAEAIARVESRNSIMAFLIGSDYKSLGKIRSEIATTDSSIARLKNAVDKTTDATVKADLEAEIKVLEESQAKVKAYVEVHENAFSLFGWAMKLFGSN